MARLSPKFVCQECGSVYKKWAGKCEACNAWNSIIEEASSGSYSKISSIPTSKSGKKLESQKIDFESLDSKVDPAHRFPCGINELDNVLGGGLVPGSAILIGGDPGIGKSTLLLQLAASLAKQNDKTCLYITGEESVDQIKMRAKRLGLEKNPVAIASATSVNDIINNLKSVKADVIIIDSIQTMYLDVIESAPGTVTQVRASAHELINMAKQTSSVLLLVGHVTKDGQIAGPKVLEHMVDAVLYFEGDRGNQFRIIRSIKNRFGPANEIGVFEMMDSGLKEVSNPSALFLSESQSKVSGSSVFAGIEGTRPMLIEIQALAAPSNMATPRRTVIGWDINRLAMIIAVLGTRAGINLFDKEVYLNVAGGLKINEPAADLAVAAALISSLTNIPLPHDIVFFGEIALSGEVRKVSHADLRIKEAEKLGFRKAVTSSSVKQKNNHFILRKINHINELKKILTES